MFNPFEGYRVFFNPDNQIIAIFFGDANQPTPTQHIACKVYWDANCSPFCYYRDFSTKYDLLTYMDGGSATKAWRVTDPNTMEPYQTMDVRADTELEAIGFVAKEVHGLYAEQISD